MPTYKQIESNRANSAFNPVLGGYYNRGILYNEATRGYWWGSEAYNGALRYYLLYDGSSLYTGTAGPRFGGFYIRCVSEEKTVLDLTYMQDMTPAIASATPENTTASLTDRRDGKLYNVAKINGNMWMTQNLRFGYDATNPDTSTMQLTPDTSDIALSSERINPTSGLPETDDGYRELTTYDLVSRGRNTSGKNQCWGTGISDAKRWGPGYQYACIHSGTIRASGDLSTVWYNYVLASAGTIFDENTDSEHFVTNTNTATESVCPKGWTLPNTTQTRSIGPNGPSPSPTYVSAFLPVLGGYYNNGVLYDETTRGTYWSNEAANAGVRHDLAFINSGLYTGSYVRNIAIYIRCVQKSTQS